MTAGLGPAWARIGGLLALLGVGGCGDLPAVDALDRTRNCRRTQVAGPDGSDDGRGDAAAVRWMLPADALERRRLDAWCGGVGPALVGGWATPSPGPVDSLLVVSWNVHVGAGRLRELVGDIRSGALTGGRPPTNFVLLLQEAYRRGPMLPEYDPTFAAGGSAGSARPVDGGDIVADAEALGLALLYVPSMRNGAESVSGEHEDRGNAVLSTLPLSAPRAIELPVARQRRVVVAGTVAGTTSGGAPWEVEVVSVHLENDAAGLQDDERARLRQAVALLAALPERPRRVLGGDVNTWYRGPGEAAVRALLEAFPDTPPFPPGPTYRRAFGLLRMYLDYLFFRLEDGDRARYRRGDLRYGSDHHPLIGWLALSAEPGA